jgi:general secretion pathway protein K
MALAQRLVGARQNAHFRSIADAAALIGQTTTPLNETLHSVNTNFMEIQGRLRLDQTVIEERSVVQRDGLSVKTLWRERGNQGVQTAPLQ